MSNVAIQKIRDTHESHPFLDELSSLLDRVRTRAFELFERRGGAHGNDLGDWLQAEKEEFGVPAVELSESEREFQVLVALPGFDTKEIKVAALPDRVIIEGESSRQHRGIDGTVHLCEFTESRAFRQIPLPKPIDVDHVSANLDKGVLHIRAAKAEPGRIRTAAA